MKVYNSIMIFLSLSIVGIASQLDAMGAPKCKNDVNVTVANNAFVAITATVYSASPWSPSTKTIQPGNHEVFEMKKGGASGLKVKYKATQDVALFVPLIGTTAAKKFVEAESNQDFDKSEQCSNSSWVITEQQSFENDLYEFEIKPS